MFPLVKGSGTRGRWGHPPIYTRACKKKFSNLKNKEKINHKIKKRLLLMEWEEEQVEETEIKARHVLYT